MLIGYNRAGVLGAVLAWLAFVLPSAAIMTAIALKLVRPDILSSAPVHGLLLAAVAVVAVAVLDMIKTLAPDARRLTFALICGAALILLPPSSVWQLIVIAVGALAGRWLAPNAEKTRTTSADAAPATADASATGSQTQQGRIVLGWALVFVALLGLSFVAPIGTAFGEAARFYQAGAFVFGGGHVILPLLQTRFVTPGIVANDAFLAGYAAAQAMPGPLFSFAAYLGAVAKPLAGIAGAPLGLLSIYLPSFVILAAIAPMWDRLCSIATVRYALAGVNAAVIGLLIAALYKPLIVSTVHAWSDFSLVVLAFIALFIVRVQPIFVLAGCAAATLLLPH